MSDTHIKLTKGQSAIIFNEDGSTNLFLSSTDPNQSVSPSDILAAGLARLNGGDAHKESIQQMYDELDKKE